MIPQKITPARSGLGPWKERIDMKDTQRLKEALLKAIEVDTMTVIPIHDIALKIGLRHVPSNDIYVMVRNICRKHPEYHLVAFTSPGKPWSVFVDGVLTCCDFEE